MKERIKYVRAKHDWYAERSHQAFELWDRLDKIRHTAYLEGNKTERSVRIVFRAWGRYLRMRRMQAAYFEEYKMMSTYMRVNTDA